MSRIIHFILLFLLGGYVLGLAQKNSFGPDRNRIRQILNDTRTEEKVDKIDALKTLPCEDANGKLFFITPLMQFLMTEMSTAGERFQNEQTLDEEIRRMMAQENISKEEFCNDMRTKMKKVESGEYTYWDLMEDLVSCKTACGKILSAMGTAYLISSYQHFKGLVRFNFDDVNLNEKFTGDHTHGYLEIDNLAYLTAAYQAWDRDRTQKIGLDARSSLPGARDYNEDLSSKRVDVVINWFTKVKDVPISQVDRKWLGSFGPHIDEDVAALYGLDKVFEQYETSGAKQTPTLIDDQTYYIYDGLNQSVSIFVY